MPTLGIGVGVPVACGIAVLRYRLWDLDVVIRKAVVVAVVTALISVAYIAIVGGVGALVGLTPRYGTRLHRCGDPRGRVSAVRHWARRFADLLVYGKRATPYEVLTDFSGRVGEAFATEDVLPRIAQSARGGHGRRRGYVCGCTSGVSSDPRRHGR